MKRVSSALLVCVIAAACDDASGPRMPDLRGTYDLSLRWVWADLDDNTDTMVCPGGLSINSQSGGTFAGSFNLIAVAGTPCSNLAGTVSGAIALDGSMTFHMMQANEPNEIGWMTNCLVPSNVDPVFAGQFNRGEITAGFVDNILCPAIGDTYDVFTFEALFWAGER